MVQLAVSGTYNLFDYIESGVYGPYGEHTQEYWNNYSYNYYQPFNYNYNYNFVPGYYYVIPYNYTPYMENVWTDFWE